MSSTLPYWIAQALPWLAPHVTETAFGDVGVVDWVSLQRTREERRWKHSPESVFHRIAQVWNLSYAVEATAECEPLISHSSLEETLYGVSSWRTVNDTTIVVRRRVEGVEAHHACAVSRLREWVQREPSRICKIGLHDHRAATKVVLALVGPRWCDLDEEADAVLRVVVVYALGGPPPDPDWASEEAAALRKKPRSHSTTAEWALVWLLAAMDKRVGHCTVAFTDAVRTITDEFGRRLHT